MNREAMIEEVIAAMDNKADMDTPWRVYAAAAVDALGWRPVSDVPDDRSFVMATDGTARWIDARTFSWAWPPTWEGRTATHWHPVHDLPNVTTQR